MSIVAIIGSAMKIAAMVLGDHYLAKWLTAGRVWWEKHAGAALKERVAVDFQKWQDEEDDLNAHLPGGS